MAKPRGLGTADENYMPKQALHHVWPHVTFTPAWFLDCGPGSATEFLQARKKWPEVRLLGLEPQPLGHAFAKGRWPAGGLLLQAAAWDRDETCRLVKADDLLHGTLFADYADILANRPAAEGVPVACRSLDSLDVEYGPFRDAFLWLDVEGSERRVLRGGAGLFARGAIRGVNIEMRPDYAREVSDLLRGHGLSLRNRYFESESCCDEVWCR